MIEENRGEVSYMVTMQQIADACGVSRGTVDRALHDKEGVRPDVAARIRETAREMGYIPARLMPQQTQVWRIGVVLHSAGSEFVQMLRELFENFSGREPLPVQTIVRAMQDMDVYHQLALIDELVEVEKIDGLALMPLANTLLRDKINELAEQKGIPVVTFNTDITDANRLAYVGPNHIASGRAAAALLGLVMGGRGHVLPILGQRRGHYADSQRLSGFCVEMEQSFPEIEILHPECSFLDEQLAERIALRAILSDPELRGIYISSAGRSGVYNALVQSGCANRVHVVVHDATPDNLELIRKGAVDFVIGQDAQTQGTLPVRLLLYALSRHQLPEKRVFNTDITVKFRCNIDV